MTAAIDTASTTMEMAFRPAGMLPWSEFDSELYSRMFEQHGICLGEDSHSLCMDSYDDTKADLAARGLGNDIEPNDDRQWMLAH